MSSLLQRAAHASKQVLANPHVQNAVEQASAAGICARDVVSKHYTHLMQQNSQYVLGNEPSFFVNRKNVYKHALFTALSEIPVVAEASAKEAKVWRQNITHFLSKPGDAVAGDVGKSLLLAVELTALFKVGEFLGRGCTIFGYWP